MTNPFRPERVLLATVFRSKKDLLEKGEPGDTAEFNNGHDVHHVEIIDVGEGGKKTVDHRKNGEEVE